MANGLCGHDRSINLGWEVILALHGPWGPWLGGHGQGVSGGMLQYGKSDSKPRTPWRGQLLPSDVGTHLQGPEGGLRS